MHTTPLTLSEAKTLPHPTGERHWNIWKRAAAPKHYVYIIQGEAGTEVKVGFTVDVDKRLKELQTGNPKILRPLIVLLAPPEVERQYHRQLAKSRVNGEWFSGPEVDQFIRRADRVARSMMAAYDDCLVAPSIYDHDETLVRPKPKVEPNPVLAMVPPTGTRHHMTKGDRPDVVTPEGDSPWADRPDWLAA
jgi:hypothetical protein